MCKLPDLAGTPLLAALRTVDLPWRAGIEAGLEHSAPHLPCPSSFMIPILCAPYPLCSSSSVLSILPIHHAPHPHPLCFSSTLPFPSPTPGVVGRGSLVLNLQQSSCLCLPCAAVSLSFANGENCVQLL